MDEYPPHNVIIPMTTADQGTLDRLANLTADFVAEQRKRHAAEETLSNLTGRIEQIHVQDAIRQRAEKERDAAKADVESLRNQLDAQMVLSRTATAQASEAMQREREMTARFNAAQHAINTMKAEHGEQIAASDSMITRKVTALTAELDATRRQLAELTTLYRGY